MSNHQMRELDLSGLEYTIISEKVGSIWANPQFYDMHLRYYRKHEPSITHDFVALIEDKGDHRLVHTKKGEVYKAEHVIISTAFRRKVADCLRDFDVSVRNKTVVFDTIGDSANLMFSRVVTANRLAYRRPEPICSQLEIAQPAPTMESAVQ